MKSVPPDMSIDLSLENIFCVIATFSYLVYFDKLFRVFDPFQPETSNSFRVGSL